jgi:hypothetical protein
MAVENKFFDTNLINHTRQDVKTTGARIVGLYKTGEIAAADTDASVYGIGLISSNWVPRQIIVMCDAITAGTDYDLGLYEFDGENSVPGAVVDKDIFMDGQTLASASRVLDGLAAVDIANINKPIWEILGLTVDSKKQYVLALTANTVGSADGTVTIRAEFYAQ